MRQYLSFSPHSKRSILLLLLLAPSLLQVHSFVSPQTPLLTRSILLHHSSTEGRRETLGNASILPKNTFKSVQYPGRTALQATTRKRDVLKKAHRSMLSKLSNASKVLMLSLTLLLAALPANAASTRSGGRMGGSFSRSSSSSRSSSMSRGSYSSSSPSSTRMYSSSPYSSRGVYIPRSSGSGGTALYYRSSSQPLDLVVPLALYGAIVYVNYQQRKKEEEDSESPLGPGISVLKFSVALDIPDREDTAGILHSLKHASETVSMDSRENVSSFVSNVCQELKQQQSKIFAACSTYDHYSNVMDAERQASTLSIAERSKFEFETINKFGGRYQSNDMLRLEEDMDDSTRKETQSTCAIVTIVLSIEGNQTKPRTTRNNSWQDVWDTLSLISAHVVKEDCLLSAEVLWTPERRGDVWTRRDIASFYPDLRVI